MYCNNYCIVFFDKPAKKVSAALAIVFFFYEKLQMFCYCIFADGFEIHRFQYFM